MRATGLGQSLEFVKAIGSLGAGAVMLWIVYTYAGFVLPEARDRAPGGSGGVQANDWLQTGLDTALPGLFLGLVFFGLIASAIWSRRYT